MQRVFLASFVAMTMILAAYGHDSWISRGSYRNAQGEWCCGEADCWMIQPKDVETKADGFHVTLRMATAPHPGDMPAAVGFEIVPYHEAMASKDGMYWRCKRPDGSRRCFFAPPPSI
jgi:hypothetical protein